MKLAKRLSIILAAIMMSCLALPISAIAEEATVTLRIEGINGNLFYGEVAIDSDATVTEVIINADLASDDLTVVGAETGYITDINGESAGTFGGWDGWMYRVNDTEPFVGMGDYAVKSEDVIVVYYSDAYGVGMQYPVVDTSDIANGVVAFTSTDVTYDESFNPINSVNPVAGLTVTIDENEYVTDKNGKIVIDTAFLAAGEHNVGISKVSENGIPLVLRFAPDAIITIPEPTPDKVATDDSIELNPDEPTTGDNSMLIFLVVMAIASLATATAVIKKRK